MIDLNIINNKFSIILKEIANNNIFMDHICENYSLRDKYTPMRMSQIFSAFEFVYKRNYGINYSRSEYYINIKKEVLESIGLLKSLKKRNRKEIKSLDSISNYLKHYDDSYATKVFTTISENENLIKSFLINKKVISNDLKDISDRLGLLRNRIQHGNMDYYYDEIIFDIKILEVIYYIILLKSVGIKNIHIKKAIKKLFQ